MKILLGVWLLAFSLWAGAISWNSSYEQALVKAKKTNKPIMVVITSETCRWCRKLEATTFQDNGIVLRVNSSFEAVNVTKDKAIYPKNLTAKMVPMSYFIDPKTSKVLYSIPGFWGVEDYNSILDDALLKYKNKGY